MFLQFSNFGPLLKNETINPLAGSDSSLGKEEMVEFLNDDEKETIDLKKEEKKDEEKNKQEEPAKEETEKIESEEELETELTELEKEIEEPTEEQLELVTPVRRREILAKYPNLFKDFPYLEKAYYREQQFTELLPTIEDAKQAIQKSETLDKFESDVMSGNTETILKAVKESDPRIFARLVDNYLPTLARVDEKAYLHVLGNTIKHTIISMVREGERSSNDTLKQAAQILNQFVFGSSDFQGPTNLARDNGQPESNQRELEIQQREQEFTRRQFESSRTDLNTRVNNVLKNTVEGNIDPKQSMSDYVRRNAIRDALDNLEHLIDQDTRFRTLVDKLWEKAFESGFDRNSTDRIRSAYISRAKTLLPSVIKKARIEALRGMGRKVVESEESEGESTPNKGPVTVGRPRSSQSKEPKEIPKNMRTLDFLMQD